MIKISLVPGVNFLPFTFESISIYFSENNTPSKLLPLTYVEWSDTFSTLIIFCAEAFKAKTSKNRSIRFFIKTTNFSGMIQLINHQSQGKYDEKYPGNNQ